MVRSQKDCADLVRPAHSLDLVYVDSLLIQTDGDDLCAAILDDADRLQIGKRLNQDDVTRPNQHPGSQAPAHLAATCNAYVLRSCHATALCSEHGGNCLPQQQ